MASLAIHRRAAGRGANATL